MTGAAGGDIMTVTAVCGVMTGAAGGVMTVAAGGGVTILPLHTW